MSGARGIMKLPALKTIVGMFGVGTMLSLGFPNPAIAQTNKNGIAALSYLLVTAEDQRVPLAIDPELISELSRTMVEIPDPAGQSASNSDLKWLNPHGFVAVPVQLTPKLRVQFVTKPATAIYCAALGYFRLDDRLAARRALVPVGCSSCEFSTHCNELRETLDQLAERRRSVYEREQDIQQSRNRLQVARAGILTGSAAQRSAFNSTRLTTGRLGADLAPSFVANCGARLQEESQQCKSLSEQWLAEVQSTPQAIRPRLQRAAMADLRSEEYYLIEIDAAIFDHARTMRRSIPADGAVASIASAGELPEDLAARRRDLRQIVTTASACVVAGMGSLDASDDEVALKQFSSAFATDRANSLARIGTGHCLVKKYGIRLDANSLEIALQEARSTTGKASPDGSAVATIPPSGQQLAKY